MSQNAYGEPFISIILHAPTKTALYDNMKAVDVLPYHTMGKVKYEQQGLVYPLEGIPQATMEQARQARSIILQGMRKARREEKA